MKKKKNKWQSNVLKANPSKQVYVSGHPTIFTQYVTEERRCVECRTKFEFSAQEQRAWYEEFGINTEVVANRCSDCRKTARHIQRLSDAIGELKQALRDNPDSLEANFAMGKALAERHALNSTGDLRQALGCLRKCLALDRKMREALYWLGCCHERLGQRAKAIEQFSEFMDATQETKKPELRTWRRDVEARFKIYRAEERGASS